MHSKENWDSTYYREDNRITLGGLVMHRRPLEALVKGVY